MSGLVLFVAPERDDCVENLWAQAARTVVTIGRVETRARARITARASTLTSSVSLHW